MERDRHLAHVLPAQMVVLMRKRPHTAMPIEEYWSVTEIKNLENEFKAFYRATKEEQDLNVCLQGHEVKSMI